MEYGYLQAGLVDFAMVFLLLIFLFNTSWFTLWGISGGFSLYWHTKKEFDLEINYVGSTISDTDKALHEKEIESYIISDKMPYRFTFSLGGNF